MEWYVWYVVVYCLVGGIIRGILGANYFEFLLTPLPQLTHLDLSGANHRDGHGDFEFLLVLQNLKSLVLHDVPGITQSALVTISRLQMLR